MRWEWHGADFDLGPAVWNFDWEFLWWGLGVILGVDGVMVVWHLMSISMSVGRYFFMSGEVQPPPAVCGEARESAFTRRSWPG